MALKLYFPHILATHSDTIRVQREFQVASELNHPNVVRVHDLVLSPSRGYSFIAMEYVEGATLKARIPRGGLAKRELVSVGRQLFEGLNELHSSDALHRDLKAANIMITSPLGAPPVLKILDLGIVSVTGDPALTGTSVFLGSKHSAPIEQLTGEEIDARADIYAAGTVLFHCYQGHPMYHKAGPEGAIVLKMMREPERLRQRSGEDSADDAVLLEFINRCIAVEAADRPSTAAECLRNLESIASQIEPVS